MALRSAPALLKAIEGFRGETAGNKAHEEMNTLLSRVVEEVHRGSAPPQDSPGRREAMSAAKGNTREMESERGHDGGSGGPTSNRPGSAGAPEPVRDITGHNDDSDKLTGHVAPSRGNRVANASASFPGNEHDIRRIIANRERSRPDTKFVHTTEKNKAGGNEDSVAEAPAAEIEGRIGDVAAPARPDNNMTRDAEGSKEQPEGKPPYAQEGLKGDGWKTARERATKRMAASKK